MVEDRLRGVSRNERRGARPRCDVRALRGPALAWCAAVVVTALAADARAVTFAWATISGTNAAYRENPGFPGGVGSVNYDYQMARTETTRGQYVEFLNAVATNTSAPVYVRGLWSGGTNFGIARTTVGGSFLYSVTGDPALPITNVSWTMAARFVNWLTADQPTITSGTAAWDAALNTGAYTLAPGNTGSTVVARNPGMTVLDGIPRYFLPSADEWVKAAFYDPRTASWNTWQTGVSAPTPTATSASSSSANAAVFGTGVAVPGYAALPVGSIPNSVSASGIYDMLGNVTEMTDTGDASGAWFAVSGNYSIAAANIGTWDIDNNRYLTTIGSANGFRVAGVLSVPEPATIPLAAVGIVALGWAARRHPAGAALAPRRNPRCGPCPAVL